MSSPGDNMAQTEPEMPEEFYEECKNCPSTGHRRYQHFDRAGCTGVIGFENGAYERCHCTNFEVKE